LYNFTTATFTNGGQTGRTGPSLTQARNGLSGPEVDSWKNDTEFFNTSNGIQLWTVPVSGPYKIESFGAQGGGATASGGLGAIISGEFILSQGEIIHILVGQQGTKTSIYSSGGGGTFVVRSPYNTNQSILVIAGGGGGQSSTVNAGGHGTTSTNGNNGATNSGGINGQGGGGNPSGTQSQGGAGFFGNGIGSSSFILSQSFVNGGTGGSVVLVGGFGGGGGASSTPGRGGGGGGYSGGAGSRSGWSGGGGSFNSGTNQNNLTGGNTGDGQVTITFLGSATLQDGLSVSSNELIFGEIFTATLTVVDAVDNTEVPYTITGISSESINNFPLTGDFVITDEQATISFTATPSAKETFTITANGYSETINVFENIYGLSLLSDSPSITFTSQSLSVIDLSASTNNITAITILIPENQATFNLAASPSVLLALRKIIVLDFASRTSFNTTEDVLDFDPPQYWIGA
jgi:hypothetical protein